MTGPAVASSGRPIAAIRRAELLPLLSGPSRLRPEDRQERDREEQRAEDAERRAEPGDRPGPALPCAEPGDTRVEGKERATR